MCVCYNSHEKYIEVSNMVKLLLEEPDAMFEAFHYNKMNLKPKLVLIYFFTIFIPIFIIGQIILTISSDKIISQTTNEIYDSTRQNSTNIKDLLNQYLYIVNRICFDTTLKSYLDISRKYESIDENLDAYKLYLKPVSNYDFSPVRLNSVLKIYFLNNTLLQDSGTYFYADDEIKASDFYKAAIVADKMPAWGIYNNEIFVSRAMYGQNGNLIAVISLEILESRLFSLIKESSNDNKSIIISDGSGAVVSSTDRSLIGKSIVNKSYFSKISAKENGVLNYKENGNYKAIFETLSDNRSMPQWRIITIIPLDSLLTEGVKIRNMGIFICGLCLIFSCSIFFLFINRITYRVKTLVMKMNGIKEGKFSKIENINETSDEIGIMIKTFNLMIESLQRLIHENYEASLKMKDIALKKKEAELYALQSQINPHFLFNTLESIRMKLHNKNDDDATEMIVNLSKILRKSLNWNGEIVLLSEEMDFVKNYLDIQKCRFKEKLSYSIEISVELTEIKIPKFIIQPIVENAIKHGLEKKRGKGRLLITASKSEENIIIMVRDDGIGIENEVLEKIRNELNNGNVIKKNENIGIKNVNDRISLLYGKNYGIKIESIKGEGTTVYLMIPLTICNDSTEEKKCLGQ